MLSWALQDISLMLHGLVFNLCVNTIFAWCANSVRVYLCVSSQLCTTCWNNLWVTLINSRHVHLNFGLEFSEFNYVPPMTL
jgi:hypothetical protein